MTSSRESRSRRPRMVVAYEAVETTGMRRFRQVLTGVWDGPRRRRLGTYWCAADRPQTSDDDLGLMVTPVYVGTKVPEDARCAECHIGIRELQDSMRELRDGCRP